MEKETIIKTNPSNTENLKVKGVTKKQLKLLQNGKLPLAVLGGLVAGIGVQFAFAKISDIDEIEDEFVDELIEDSDSESEAPSESSEELFDFEAPTSIAFSESVTDDMSFGEAFSTARSEMGPGGFFNWKGSSYHTLNKEEWDALSNEERNEYTQKIKDNTNFEDGKYNKVDPDDTNDTDIVPDKDKNSEDEEEDHKGDNEEDDTDMIIPEDEQEFADLDEIITEEELLADLNQEVAFNEEEGNEGGIVEEEEDLNNHNDEVEEEESDDSFLADLNDDVNHVKYDSDFGDDLVQGSDNLDDMDIDLD